MKSVLNIISVLLLLNFSSNCSAQSFKKVFKNITKGDIPKAYEELDKFDDDNRKYSSVEMQLYLIGAAIILSNENSKEYSPYQQLADFKKNKIPESDIPQIKEFLNDFNLDLDKVQDIIYQNILIFSKKENTEASYDNALSVCTPCNYKQELLKLRELTAFNECKAKGSILAYEYFLDKYDDSIYTTDITLLLNGKAYEDAKNKMTLKAMGDYIENYPKSSLIEKATSIRDSLALPKEPKNFKSVSVYIKTYPNSRFNPQLKLELPDLLYHEAITKNSFNVLKQFIDLYPNDKRADDLTPKLEMSYVELLRGRFKLNEFNYFKSKFPNSIYLKEFNAAFNEQRSNSDLGKEGLNGNVHFIEINIYDFQNNKNVFNSKRVYNEFGKRKSIIANDTFSDPIEDFEMINLPNEFNNEFLIVLPFCRTKSSIDIENGLKFGFGGSINLKFNYDDEGNLINVDGKEFKYDSRGNLIEKIFPTEHGHNAESEADQLKKIIYKWKDDKLISKGIYKGNGEIYKENYEIEYEDNFRRQIIKPYHQGINQRIYDNRYIVDYNPSGEIYHKRKESYYSSYNPYVYDRNYSYSNGHLIEIVETSYTDDGKSHIVKTNIQRDKQGNILKIGKTEFKYKYDEFNNWILREDYDLKEGDITIRKKIREISRIITYY